MTTLDVVLEQILRLDPTPFVLAVVLGGAVGLERELHGRPAGLRTHMLVCLASTLLILVSRRLPAGYAGGLANTNLVLDPTRLAAGIMTGIGFLGASTVIRSGDLVRGLTTGACIWAVAALGVVIGHEAYGAAVVSTGTFLVVLVLFDWLEKYVTPIVYRRLVVRSALECSTELAAELRAYLRGVHVRVQDVTGRRTAPDGPCELVFHVRCRNRLQGPELIRAIGSRPDVTAVEWS